MSTLEISKHQLYFKQMVISVESWAWQSHQELLQGKTVQTQLLFPLPSSIPTFFWITVTKIQKSNTKRDFWQHYQIFMKDISTSSKQLSMLGICKALRALPSSLRFYILGGVFLTLSMVKIPSSFNHLLWRWKL